MSFKTTLPVLLFLTMMSGALSACVSGGVIEVGVEPNASAGLTESQETPAPEVETPLPTNPSEMPSETPVPDNHQVYSNGFFGFQMQFPVGWYGPDEYVVDNIMRLAIGSDVVYPYGTDRLDQVYTVKNAYYITIQYTLNNQNQYFIDQLNLLRSMQDGESVSTARSELIRVREVKIGNFEGLEYISTLSSTAQTEPVYTREILLVDPQSNMLTISGSPNNVEIAAGSDWRTAYKAVDEANQDVFHEIADSIAFSERNLTGNGVIRGSLCFPSEMIPPMNLFFKNAVSGEIYEMPTLENQSTFEISVESGYYYAYAYLVSEPNMGGGYTNAVACGLTIECSDHTMLAVEVLPGMTSEDVKICDFYAPEFLPPNPKAVESSDSSVAGLIYRWMIGQFRVDNDGQARMIAGMQSMPSYSPDGKKAVFAKDDEIWLLDLSTHQVLNLTNTPDRIERDPQWWPANPDVVIFGSATLEQGYDIMSGHLTMVRLTNNNFEAVVEGSYQVLSPDFISNTTPALSPDGQTIAYDNGSQLWQYHLESNTARKINLDALGLTGVQQLGSPAWSPDGSKLALWVGGQYYNNDWGIGMGIIDFATSTSWRLHTYQPLGTGGWITTPQWSPDGQWLAASTVGEDRDSILWLIKADGTTETSLGAGMEPVWSSDGRLLYVSWNPGSSALVDSRVYALRPGESPQKLSLTPGSVPVFWIAE